MPDPTFIPGWQATVTLDSDDFSAVGSVVSLNLSRASLPKPRFGSPYQNSLGGQRSGQFSANGHISTEKVAALTALFNSDEPIDFSLQLGIAASATDGGLYTGACQINQFTVEANADGEWDWSLQATTDGDVTYTPAGGGS